MRTCTSCGFDQVGDDSSCPLCGSDPASASAATILESDRWSQQPTIFRHEVSRLNVLETETLECLFAGRYRIERELGSGGMGSVYRVTDTKSDVRAALKILHSSVTRSPQGLERFEREMNLLSRVSHTAIPALLDWGHAGSRAFCVTELVDGADLRAESKRRGLWDIAEVIRIGASAADALAVAHEAGIIHRDVKPHNIMLGADGGVFVVDFGLARPVGLELEAITDSGLTVGTPHYMSPEQFDGRRLDARSDLYSLGAVLFELLTGRPPFVAESLVEIGIKHRTELPPLPRALRRDIPAWLESLVLRCLEKDPADRFLSVRELAAELRRPRTGMPRRRILPTGDVVIHDDSGRTDWNLQIASADQRDWTVGMALIFEGRSYRLEQVTLQEESVSRPWLWSFRAWPDEEIFRRIVDYDESSAEHATRASWTQRLRRWLHRR